MDIPQKPERKIHSKKALELMLANGEDFVDVVQKHIDDNKLPYEIVTLTGGTWSLKDTLNPGELHLAKFITVDEETKQMKIKASKAANTSYEVLISGATGTGKEIIARSQIGNRSGAFRAINCAGIPETLIESTLFGYIKGSFTGANGNKNGFITEANGGVMFMDEIGELPLLMQAKLLRTIQEKRITKVGSTEDEDISCKFVFATNRNLEEMVKAGTFREDLYARISTLELDIKSLKDRLCDAVPICKSLVTGDKFLERYESELRTGLLDLSHNVRSIQRHVIRYNVWGSIN
jgi:transcriptional regulator with PAS, ATPase and Fis domain